VEPEPQLIYSARNGRVTRDGVTVEVSVYKFEHDTEWQLEVVNEKGTSIVWQDAFTSVDAAFAAFEEVVAEEGMTAFLDEAKIIPFPRS
jgi:uncharacterized protein